MSSYNYILTIDTADYFNADAVIEKLDLCLDWSRLLYGVYLIRSNSDKDTIYTRFKTALGDTKFFITRISLKDMYTGWLPSKKWDRIKEFKSKEK
jgi:hypothetical protein